jgi:peptidyl-prolyl cis-trans isomerase C
MIARVRWSMAAFIIAVATSSAQTPPEKSGADQVPPPPAATVVAAMVNGQDITELAVYRGLLREHPQNWAGARKEILNYLIDNLLIDQYLTQLKVGVEAKEVEERFEQIKEEAKKSKHDFQDILKKLLLTEADLRKELHAALRWDKFVLQQGTDKVLLDYFQKNSAMFDGSQTQARHILVSAKDDAEGQGKIAVLKKQIEEETIKELAKLPAPTDKLGLDKQRTEAILKSFAAAADKESSCPSKKQGGDLGWFPRVGAMVEPFARTAFALQPFQLSDAVKTEFGYHLILAVDRKAGREVQFEDVKPFVAEIYGERLREAILTSYKPRSKIVIHDVSK